MEGYGCKLNKLSRCDVPYSDRTNEARKEVKGLEE